MTSAMSRGHRRVPRIFFFALLLVIIAGQWGYSAAKKTAGSAESLLPLRRRTIILIVMDTVRQDRLSCYGYSRDTSPNLRKLSETSRVYDKAYSTSGWTAPAHASLFTGLFPIAHGTTQENWTMDEKLATLAEVLSAVGYKPSASAKTRGIEAVPF